MADLKPTDNPRNIGGLDANGKIVRGSLADDEITAMLQSQLTDPDRNPESEPELRRAISRTQRRGVSVAQAPVAQAAAGGEQVDLSQALFTGNDTPDISTAAVGYKPPQPTDEPVSDAAKSLAAGALTGLGSIAQGGGELLARGVNALTGEDTLRSANPLQGAIDWLNQSQSDVTKQAVGESQISGDTLDPTTWKFGKNPSLRGLAMQGLNAIGQIAPNLALALTTAGMSVPAQLGVGAVVGGLQALGPAAQEERETYGKLNHQQLTEHSALYNALIERGVSREEAKHAVMEAAALGGGLGNALPSAAEGAFENFIVGALTKGFVKLPRLGLGVAGKVISGGVGGALSGGAEEDIEQRGQTLGSNLAVGGDRPVGEGTLQNFVLGAIAQGGAGMALAPLEGSRAPQKQPQAEQPPMLDLGNGIVVKSGEELQRALAPMHISERAQVMKEALERFHGGGTLAPFSADEWAPYAEAFSSVPVEKQGEFLWNMTFPEQAAQEGAGATQEQQAAPVPQHADVPAKDVLRTAKKMLDTLHKQMIEAQPQLASMNEKGEAIFEQSKQQTLTPDQQELYKFLTANLDNPIALAQKMGVKLAPESPTKQGKVQEGGEAVSNAVRAAKGQSAIGDTIERGQQQAEREISKAREVQQPAAPAQRAAPVAPSGPDAAAAVKSMEGDLSALVAKRAPAASSKLAGTVAQATKVIADEEQKTEAHKRAVEKSKALEAERAAKKTAKQVVAKPAAAATTPPAASTAGPAAPAKAASVKPQSDPKKVKEAPAAPKTVKPAAVVQDEARRAKDFTTSGNYEIEIAGKKFVFFRDPENKQWYEDGTGKHFSENFLGFTKDEAIAALRKRHSTPGPKSGPISPKLGSKGAEAVAKSKAKEAKAAEPKLSPAEQNLVKEVKSILKKYPGTATPVAMVRKELGLPHDIAKRGVALALGMPVDADFARKHTQRTGSTQRVSVGLAPGGSSPLAGKLGREIQPERAERILDHLAQLSGVKIVNRERGVGAYLQYVEGALQVDVSGTPEQVKTFMDMVGYALQQTEVISTRVDPNGSHHAIDVFAPEFADLGKAREFFEVFLKLQPKDSEGNPIAPGFQQTRMGGDHALRFLNFGGLWDGQQVAGILAALEKAADETATKVTDLADRRVAFATTANDWSHHGSGQAYLAALNDAGRVREVAELERRYAPSRSDAEVADDFARKAAQPAPITEARPGGGGSALAVLRDRVARHLQRIGVEGDAGAMLDLVGTEAGADKAPASEGRRKAQAVAKLFGYELHFFRNTQPGIFDFDGIAPAGTKLIFVNEKTERPLMQVVGHELLHKMRQSDPAVYAALTRALRSYYNDSGVSAHAERLFESAKGESLDGSKVEEEFLADGVGRMFEDEGFLQSLGEGEPAFAMRVMNAMKRLLDRVLEFFGKQKQDEFFTNVQRAREHVLTAMENWSKRSTEMTAEADFARKTRKQQIALGQQINSMVSTVGRNMNATGKRQMEFKLGARAFDMLSRWIANHESTASLNPFGNMPEKDKYLELRGLAQGNLGSADAEARAFSDSFKDATPDQQRRIKQYLTHRSAPKAMIGDVKLGDAAEALKKKLIDIGADLVKAGFLDAKDYEANKGMYLPRLYLRHLLDEAANRALGTGKRFSDLGYTKKRGNLDEVYRRAFLGEIDDPSLLAGVAVGKPLRDIATLDWMRQIAANHEWVWEPSLTKHNGQEVSVAWVRNNIEAIREQMAHYTDPKQIKDAEAALVTLQQSEADAVQRAGGTKAPEHFVEMPNTPQYGILRGMYVRKEVYNDLIGTANVKPQNFAESLFGYGGAGTRITQWWKASKVSLNPPAQIRNFLSNFMLLQLSGVATHRMPQRIAQAIDEIIKKGSYYQLAQKHGLTMGTFAAQELYRIKDEFLADKAEGGIFSFLAHARKIASFAGDAYQFMETIGKLVKMIDMMESYNASEGEAALEANKWLFDYSQVPGWVRFMRNAPLGMPFLTFYYKLAPRLVEVALKYPWRYAPYIAAAYVIPQMVAAMGGPTPDDQDRLKLALAKWLREKQHVYVLPHKDEHGHWTFIDLSYLVPFTMFTDAVKQLAEGHVSETIKTVGLFNGPITDVATAILTNKDSFTGRDIANPGDPTGLQVGAWLTYLYNLAVPPIITNHNLIGPDFSDPTHVMNGRLPSALNGTTNKYGDPRNTVSQALLGALGLNIYPVNPDSTRSAELSRMLFEIDETQRAFAQKVQDRSLSQEQRQHLADVYNAEVNDRVKKMQKYARDSQVPANLK